MKTTGNKNPVIVILGASFETSNMGVGALAWSCIKVVLNRWPGAEIHFVGGSKEYKEYRVLIDGGCACIPVWPVRYCRNVFAANHILHLLFWALLARCIPAVKRHYAQKKNTVATLCRADMIADITLGDSFSDIYGKLRFWYGTLPKLAGMWISDCFVLLPQTYGPFTRRLTRSVAKYIIKRSHLVFCRDRTGIDELNFGPASPVYSKVRIVPDLAFALEPRAVDLCGMGFSEAMQEHSGQIVGLNINGLLYNGGYGRKSEDLVLRCNYADVTKQIIEHLVSVGCLVILVPHVVSGDEYRENDLDACREIRRGLPAAMQSKVFPVERTGGQFFDPCEIKYVIGKCDFFIGARMHSCIAALSQGIPTIGLAYSRKFEGVFASVGVEDGVVDLRRLTDCEVVEATKRIYNRRCEIRRRLGESIPAAKEAVVSLLSMGR